MAAEGSYNPATKILTITGDGMPTPVSYGTFPNVSNPYTPAAYTFNHSFLYRGGENTTASGSTPVGIIGMSANGVAIYNASAANGPDAYNVSVTVGVDSVSGQSTGVFYFNGIEKPAFDIKIGATYTFDQSATSNANYNAMHHPMMFSTSSDGELAGGDHYMMGVTYKLDGVTKTMMEYVMQFTSATTRTITWVVPSNAPSTLHYWCHYHTGQGNQLNLSSTVGDPPSGFHWVSAGDEAMVTFGEDGCGGHPEASGQYHYHDADMLSCWKTNQVMAGYNDYYGQSQFGQDNMRHPDGHSKILGFAFDGYPVYGPYGYNNPTDNTSAVVLMKTGYQQKMSIATGRPAFGTTFANPPIGALMEDYEYNADTSGRHLDVYNGRFCNTPEFPSGTFAYFTTVWEDQTETKEYTVTVTSETDGNRYRIDGALHPNLTFIKGSTYKFILSDASNLNHNLLLSDASDGFHGAGTTYTSGVTQVGTSGTAGAYIEITVGETAPSHLYYFCQFHPSMSGTSTITVVPNRYLTPKFPYIFGLSSKQTLNIPSNQGVGAPPASGGESEGGSSTPQTPSLVITNQPTNATIADGGTQTFSLIAEIEPEAGTIAYQWQVSTDGGFTWANLTGQNSSSLQVVAQAFMSGYRYRCVCIGPVGEQTQASNSPLASNLAILTVTGGTSQQDTSGILKWDSNVGKFDMTSVPFDRDNNNPDFTRNNIRLDATNYEFDLT